MTVASKFRWGRKEVLIPLFTVSALLEGVSLVGILGIVGQGLPLAHISRLGCYVFLVAAVLHINDRINCKAADLARKIDDSVGAVWDGGGRAEARRRDAMAEAAKVKLALVRDMVPRQ